MSTVAGVYTCVHHGDGGKNGKEAVCDWGCIKVLGGSSS